MKKTFKLIFIFSFIIILSTGCVKRRLTSLEDSRIGAEDMKIKDLSKDQKPNDENVFFPDDVKKFKNYEDYFSWYDSLKEPPELVLPDPEDPKELTKQEMIEDYEYLFKTIKDNYPFIKLIEREYGYNFLDEHDKYLSWVKDCNNDEDFYEVLEKIIDELKNQHAMIADSYYVENSLEHYSHYWDTRSMFLEFLYMNTQTVRNRYNLEGKQISDYKKINDENRKKEDDSETSNENIEIKDISDDIISIKINEMLADYNWKQDEEILDEFIEKLPNYKALVIDIRGNGGGNIDYWQEFFLPRIIDKKYKTDNYMFFKDGDRTKIVLGDNDYNYENIKDVDINSLNLEYSEDLKDFSYFAKDSIEVSPKNSISFKGNIYLLVDEEVFSAAETMASFCKNTSLATLVGKKTGGDGITLGVINDYLPNSGYVFSFTNSLGYAKDGSLNEEDKTDPDIKAEDYRQMIDAILEKEGER
ncbi:MAG: S41 family peptidase [Tissierellia bacterium]|nr:S41 family peptidase [Tissierellia bacterium]